MEDEESTWRKNAVQIRPDYQRPDPNGMEVAIDCGFTPGQAILVWALLALALFSPYL